MGEIRPMRNGAGRWGVLLFVGLLAGCGGDFDRSGPNPFTLTQGYLEVGGVRIPWTGTLPDCRGCRVEVPPPGAGEERRVAVYAGSQLMFMAAIGTPLRAEIAAGWTLFPQTETSCAPTSLEWRLRREGSCGPAVRPGRIVTVDDTWRFNIFTLHATQDVRRGKIVENHARFDWWILRET